MRVGRDNTKRLGWVIYYKYNLDGKECFIKEKAYSTSHDGWIDAQEVKKQTYKNALKRKNKCHEIAVEENILDIPISYLAIILKSIYGIDNHQLGKHIVTARDKTKKIKEQSYTSPLAEYKIFKSLFDKELEKEVQQDEENQANSLYMLKYADIISM